jgi:hypothetical protein
MNKIWPIGLIWLLAVAGDRGSQIVAKQNANTHSLPSVGQALQATDRQVDELPEPPEVVDRLQKIIDSLSELLPTSSGES